MCEYEEKVGNKTQRIRSKTFNISLVQNNTFELEDLQYGRSIQYEKVENSCIFNLWFDN